MRYQERIMPRVLCAMIALSLGGCATFRNRNMDYLRQDVNQSAPVAVPPGMSQEKATPALVVPPGQNTYPAEAKPNPMLTPPAFAESASSIILETTPVTVVATAAPAQKNSAPAANKTASTVKTSTNTTVTANQTKPIKSVTAPAPVANQTAVEAPVTPVVVSKTTAVNKAPIAATEQSTPVVKPVATSLPPVQAKPVAPVIAAQSTTPAKVSAPVTVSSSTAPAKEVPAPVTASSSTVPTPVVASSSAVVSAVVTHPSAPSASAASQPLVKAPLSSQTTAAPKPKALETTLVFDSNNVGVLQVKHASISEVFDRVGDALGNSNYVISSQNADQGYYYVTPKGVSASGYGLMISIWQYQGTPTVQIYDMNGNPATSEAAHDLLSVISAALGQ